MQKLALFKGLFAIIYSMFNLYTSSGFCSGDRSNIKVTSTNGKSAHVTWDTSHVTCNPNVIGYKVHYNFVLNGNIIYKSTVVNGERTGNTDLTTFPNFQYSIYVNPMSNIRELTVPRPESFNFTAQKELPGAPPSGLSVVSVSSDKITVKWDKLGQFERNGNILGYQIYYKAYQEVTAHGENITGENTLTADLTGLIPSSKYGIFIRAIGEVGYGPSTAVYTNTRSVVKSSTSTVTKVTTTSASTSKTLIKTSKPISNNLGSLNPTIPKKTNSIIYTPANTHTTSRRSLASQKITSITTVTNDQSSQSTDASTSVTKGPESDKQWDRILLIVGIAFGILLLIAICVPIVLHLCRCCDKGAAGSGGTSSKDKEEKIPVREKIGFKNIKNGTRSPPLPVTRLRRQASTLSRQQSYELKSDNQRSINDYDSYDRFTRPAHDYDENEGNYLSETDIESVSDVATSDNHHGNQGTWKIHKPEFKVWPEFQNNPYKSRLIDFWKNAKFGNKEQLDENYPDFPPGFLHTDFSATDNKFESYTYPSRESGRTSLSTEDLQYHSRSSTDGEYHGLIDTRNTYRGLETRDGKTNGKIIQHVTTPQEIPKNSANKKQLFDRALPYFPEKLNEKTEIPKDNFNHLFNKRLKNTNNVYIHNFMAFKGVFPKHPRHSQVFPVHNPAYDSGSNSDETESHISNINRGDFTMDKNKSKMRAIAYEPV